MPWPMRLGPLPRMMTFLLRRRLGLAHLLEGAVHVRRERLELGRAGVDALVGGHQPVLEPRAAAPAPRPMPWTRGDVGVAEAGALQRAQQVGRHLAELARAPPCCRSSTISRELLQEPAGRSSSARAASRRVQPRRSARNSAHIRRSFGTTSRLRSAVSSSSVVGRVVRAGREQAAALAELERPHRLEERLLERAADRHRLAHRLHLRRQRRGRPAGTSRSSSAGT